VGCAASLAACGTAVKVPERAAVAVGVSCVDEAMRPARPAEAMRPEAEIRALDDYKVIPRLRADRLRLIAHVERLEAIVDGCARAPRP
jgi:hypothetical protein